MSKPSTAIYFQRKCPHFCVCWEEAPLKTLSFWALEWRLKSTRNFQTNRNICRYTNVYSLIWWLIHLNHHMTNEMISCIKISSVGKTNAAVHLTICWQKYRHLSLPRNWAVHFSRTAIVWVKVPHFLLLLVPGFVSWLLGILSLWASSSETNCHIFPTQIHLFQTGACYFYNVLHASHEAWMTFFLF